MKQKQHKATKGMFTLELTLLFPIIFGVILIMMYLSAVHYQNIVLSSAAMQSANRIAANWQYLGGSNPSILRDGTAEDMLRKSDFVHSNPYRNLMAGGERLENAQRYANKVISGSSGFYTGGQKPAISVRKVTENFFNSYIEVTVTQGYINPFGNLYDKLGFTRKTQEKMRATAPLVDKTEFIRTIVFIEELL